MTFLHTLKFFSPVVHFLKVVNHSQYAIIVYLSFFVLGDPMLLHHLIKTKPLDMASLESYSEQELRAICRECKIDKIAKLSKVHPLCPLTCAYSIKFLLLISVREFLLLLLPTTTKIKITDWVNYLKCIGLFKWIEILSKFVMES